MSGQSLAAATSQGFYTPTNSSKVDQINPMNGEMLVGVDPLVGPAVADASSNRATSFLRMADQLVSAGKYQRVILIPAAVGGTTVAMWADTLHQFITDAYRRAAALGIPITGILWQLGETDNVAGTSQASYQASFNTLRAKIVAAGCTAPWVLAKSTYVPGGATSAAVRAAITALVDGVNTLAGPDFDTLGSSNRYDDQHWNSTGNAAAAALWTSAVQATLP